ncbi:MAG: 3-deoxy-manno-octulosonate cytidylyltransferase [Burkholderiaceae bacterium]|nr:3-deoxy-manno-octulosonate cytidylyltransferase [Burkholderiaceae bacterium]
MDFLVVVPARLASTRLPRKPLADIGGVPMVVRVARQAARSGASRVVVAADSTEIVQTCRVYGIECMLTSTEHTTGTDRIAETVKHLAVAPETIVVNVQADEPLMPSDVVDRVARLLNERDDCEIATAAHPIDDAAEFFSPDVVKVVVNNRDRAITFSRAPIPWSRDAFAAGRTALPPGLGALRHVGLYAYRAAFLFRYPNLPKPAIEEHEKLEQLRAIAHGVGIAVLRLTEPLPPGVDTPADLQRMRENFAS